MKLVEEYGDGDLAEIANKLTDRVKELEAEIDLRVQLGKALNADKERFKARARKFKSEAQELRQGLWAARHFITRSVSDGSEYFAILLIDKALAGAKEKP